MTAPNPPAPAPGAPAVAPSAPLGPSWLEQARLASEVLIEQLLLGRRELGETGIDADALRDEANRILDTHAGTIASLSVGALFDLLARTDGFSVADGKAYREAYGRAVAALDAEALAEEAEATADVVELVRAAHAQRVALLAELASASSVVVRGVVGAALAAALGTLG